jgi:hypothetical protein
MRAFPIEVDEGGRLRLPSQVALPANAQLAVLVLESPAEGEGDLSSTDVARLAEASGALDFLKDEPDLYTDADIEPGHHNPDFAGHAPSR